MTTVDLASALHEVQAKLAGAELIAEFAHGIDSRDLERALATWHPDGVFTIAPDTVLSGTNALRAHLEETWAAYPEVYQWVTNLTISVTGETTMRGECRLGAMLRAHSGTTLLEVATDAFECTKETGDWLFASHTLTIHRVDTMA